MTTEMAQEEENSLKQRFKNKENDNKDNAATEHVDSNEKAKKKIASLERKIYKDLPAVEFYLYALLWLGSISYASYLFHLESRKRRSALPKVKKYKPWWYPLEGYLYQDQYDHEWETWKFMASNSTWLFAALLFPVVSQVVKNVSLRWNTLITCIYSVIFTISLVGLKPVLYMMVQLILIFLVYLLTNKAIFVWIVALGYTQLKIKFDDYVFQTYEDWVFAGYLTMVSTAWMNSRCVSFCLDRIWGRVPTESSIIESFMNLTAYCFYLPLGVMGPLITSKEFKEGMEKRHDLDSKLAKFTIGEALKYLIWFLVLELQICYVYNQSFTAKPFFVESMNMWELCGMCFLLGQFFNFKYVLMYGCSSYLAKLDNIDAPPHPKWIGRIHLYSDMWRHFDAGLYKFMHAYIYTPLASVFPDNFAVRMIITIIIFGFVYVWHGVQDFILVWSILNCIGILSENISREIGKTKAYSEFESGLLSTNGQRRFHAMLGAPLFLMSCLSNFYFFTGMQVGNIIVRRVFSDTWPIGFPYLIFIMYCGSQFSIQVKNWELREEINKLKEKNKLHQQ